MNPDLATSFILLAVLVCGYMLPWIVALGRHHRQAAPIFVVNLLLGWTGIGWIAALAWAVASDGRART